NRYASDRSFSSSSSHSERSREISNGSLISPLPNRIETMRDGHSASLRGNLSTPLSMTQNSQLKIRVRSGIFRPPWLRRSPNRRPSQLADKRDPLRRRR